MTDKENTTVSLGELERMAFEIDRDIRVNNISNDKNEKHQKHLDKIAKDITGENSIGSASYIAYEVQALLHWANGDKDEAAVFIADAVNFTGDSVLFTQTGNKIAQTVSPSATGGNKPRNRALKWYEIIIVGGVVNLVGALLGGMAGAVISLGAFVVVCLGIWNGIAQGFWADGERPTGLSRLGGFIAALVVGCFALGLSGLFR